MGTVSRLPEKIRIPVPIIESETEAYDGIHALIRRLSAADAGIAATGRSLSPLLPAINGSGLLGITVPCDHGGADVSNIVLGEIVLAAAAASRSAAAALASHFHSVELLRDTPATGLCSYFYVRALAGDLFLMIGSIDNSGDGLRLVPETTKPGWRLTGNIHSEIDPIHADWIVIRMLDGADARAIFIPRMTPGLRLSPDQASFMNVHVAADCVVPLVDTVISTAGPLASLLQSAQKLGWAERKLNERVALHARPAMQRLAIGDDYLSALGLTVSRIESGKAALERAGRRIDTAQVNANAETVQAAAFSAAIALSSAAEACDLACMIAADHQPPALGSMDPYGHAPIGARLLEISIH